MSGTFLPSSLFDPQKISATPTAAGEVRPFFDAATRTLARLETHLTTLNPGEISHAAHRHADEELIIVQAGTVEATINGVGQEGGAGSVFFFASMDLHGLRNPGKVRASYHVIRIFPRDLGA
jgi:XRE family transcriptional regulator, regulator of sulfur utilization